MPNHPNRNANSAAARPLGAQIRTARLAADLTPKQAGALIYERASRWLAFEEDRAPLHPAAWELWQHKVARRLVGEWREGPGARLAAVWESADAPVAACLGTLPDLARAVWGSDGCPRAISEARIADVLDVALRTRLGIATLGGRRCAIDLGNGYSLICETRVNE